MTNRAIISAVENNFVPLLIYNNQKGADTGILKKYGEPAWNYQVIRFLDSNGKDIIPRKDRINTLGSVARRMIQTLEKAKRPVPDTLRALIKSR